MRAHGAIDSVLGYGPFDHACWGYDSDDERRRVTIEWLADGVRHHQRLVYVADGRPDELLADLTGLAGRDQLVERGELEIHATRDLYDLSRPIDAPSQLALYAGTVDRAVADGYVGVRVVADITPLVADASRHAAHVRWEHAADRYMVGHPLAPLCTYDATIAGSSIESIVCVHPLRRTGDATPPFSLWASDSVVVLEGEADGLRAGVLADVLDALGDEGDVVIDVSMLRFVDGRAAFVLHRALGRLRDRGQHAQLRGSSSSLRALWHLLGFEGEVLVA
jgi:anti-anti-sigma regulatory factor